MYEATGLTLGPLYPSKCKSVGGSISGKGLGINSLFNGGCKRGDWKNLGALNGGGIDDKGRVGDPLQGTQMDRLKRLQALQAERSSTKSTGRKKIEAKVLHVNAKEDENKTEEERMRKEMKEMALKKRQEEELRRTARPVEVLPVPKPMPVLDESSDSSDSSEDEPVLLKPVFVPKTERQTFADAEEQEDDYERLKKERHDEAHALLAEYVRFESVAAKRKDEELEATSGALDPKSVDDTDDLDEEAESQAWKLRELLRIKRDRTEREAREREQIELERLRNLTEAEKQEIDKEKLKAWEDKPKSEYKFLQKYYHKGAFFADNTDDALLNRDYAQPTGEDHARKDFLPETMQVKNFGKRGRTKWTHLTNEDTTDYHTGWGHRKNQANYRLVDKMAGMKDNLERPPKNRKT